MPSTPARRCKKKTGKKKGKGKKGRSRSGVSLEDLNQAKAAPGGPKSPKKGAAAGAAAPEACVRLARRGQNALVRLALNVRLRHRERAPAQLRQLQLARDVVLRGVRE